MNFLSRFITSSTHLDNTHRNHICCIESDYSCKPCDELFRVLRMTQDEDLIQGLKKLLISRGYSRHEIEAEIAKGAS